MFSSLNFLLFVSNYKDIELILTLENKCFSNNLPNNSNNFLLRKNKQKLHMNKTQKIAAATISLPFQLKTFPNK